MRNLEFSFGSCCLQSGGDASEWQWEKKGMPHPHISNGIIPQLLLIGLMLFLFLFNSFIITSLIHVWIYIQGSILLDSKLVSQHISWLGLADLIQKDMACWYSGCKMQHLFVIMLTASRSGMICCCNLPVLVRIHVVKKMKLFFLSPGHCFWLVRILDVIFK